MIWTRQDLAKGIRTLRAHLNLTQREFGKVVGVSEATISRWEAEKHLPENEHVAKLVALMDAVGIKTKGLLSQHLAIRERERMAAAIEGDAVKVGAHQIQLLSDGAILVNGHIRIDNPETNGLEASHGRAGQDPTP